MDNDQIPIYTDLTINSNNNKSLKRYFNSIKRNLPKAWKIDNSLYIDIDTHRILLDVICIKSFEFENEIQKKKFSAKLFLGLTSVDIRLLKIEVIPQTAKDETLEIIGFIVNDFHLNVLQINNHYKDFEHIFQFGGPRDQNWHANDIRDSRSIILSSKKKSKYLF